MRIAATHGGDVYMGPIYVPPTAEERRAACINCGRPPFNFQTVEALTGHRSQPARDEADIRFERRALVLLLGLWTFVILAVVAAMIATR